jgi:Zn-dependent peptidase ImmA (M78 family)/transcriptional regulator with XRE-family HTH domain
MKLGTIGFVGERLREAREARGLTAISLAGIVGVTRAAVSQYEQGVQSPRPDVMSRICECLNLPLAFFMRPPLTYDGTIYWRSLASTTKTARQAAERKLNWLQDFVGYAREYVEFPECDFPHLDLPSDPLRITDAEIETIASAARKYWGLGEGPIPSAITLIENSGVFVARDDLYVTALDGLSRWSQNGSSAFCLIASGKDSAVRSRMDLFHELGHLLLHKDIDQRYVTSPEIHRAIENQAFRFAGAFALPEESFTSEIYSLSLDAFVRLKEHWKVAVGAMIKRCEQLGVVSETQSERLWRTWSSRGWRTHEPLDDEMPIERPQMLSSALQIMLRQGLRADDLTCALALTEADIEQLASVPLGTLSGTSIREIAPSPRSTTRRGNGPAGPPVIEFRRGKRLS